MASMLKEALFVPSFRMDPDLQLKKEESESSIKRQLIEVNDEIQKFIYENILSKEVLIRKV